MEDLESDANDAPKLSSSAMTALQEFYAETDTKERSFQDLKAAAEVSDSSETILSMDCFTENWNSSQFWYNHETAIILAKQLLEGAVAETRIAVVSAPSVFMQIKNLLISNTYQKPARLCLLEYDTRFSVLREFIHYDFQSPFNLPGDMKGQFDRIICDPPFLSEDCQTKAATTVRWLSQPAAKLATGLPQPKIIICTGERMGNLIPKIYPGSRTTTFEPQHAQSRLSNEFRCFANYECSEWSWR